jgi:hypothetical protein
MAGAPPYIICSGTGTTPITASITAATASGDGIFGAYCGSTSGTGISDSKSNSYTRVTQSLDTEGDADYAALPTTPLTTSDTMTFNGAVAGCAAVGFDIPGCISRDSSSQGSWAGGSSTAPTCSSITPSAANETVVAIFFCSQSGYSGGAASTGFTLLGTVTWSSGNYEIYITYQVGAGTSALTPALTGITPPSWSAIAWAYKVNQVSLATWQVQRRKLYGQQ